MVVNEGTWVIKKTTGPRTGLFGWLQTPKFHIYRMVVFYSRLTGPDINYTWKLEGPITFAIGQASEKSIEMPQDAPIVEWNNIDKMAMRNSELLPEPFSSTLNSRILKPYNEY